MNPSRLRRGVLAGSLLTTVLGALAAGPGLAHYIDLRGELVETGMLTLGIALSGRPFAYREEGTLRGFEIDFAREVAHSRGLDFAVEVLPRSELAEALRARRVDLIATLPLESSPENVTLVPYLVLGDHVMILRGNPFGIGAPLDLAGHTVAALAGSSAEAFARETDRKIVAAGRKAMAIHTFPYQRDVHFPVSMGHAAAYFVQSRTALVAESDPESRVRILPGAFRPIHEVGFALRAGDRALIDAVRHAIAAKLANGAYDRLRADFGIPDTLSPFR